jgi:hypothetical protein
MPYPRGYDRPTDDRLTDRPTDRRPATARLTDRPDESTTSAPN